MLLKIGSYFDRSIKLKYKMSFKGGIQWRWLIPKATGYFSNSGANGGTKGKRIKGILLVHLSLNPL